MKRKYLEYEGVRKILKQRQIVRSSPERRDEIEQIITLLDNLVFKPKARWRVSKAFPHWLYCSNCNVRMVPNVEMVEKYGIPVLCCPCCGEPMERGDLSFDLFSPETVEVDCPKWMPVTPETMPPYEEEFINTTGDLLLRTVWNGYVAVYAGYYHDGRWWTYMETGTEILSEGTFVTHWMPLEELLKGVKEAEARNDG